MSNGKFLSEPERRQYRPYTKYKDSGVEWLGEIPAHWDVKPFKALLSRNDGGVWGEDFADDGVFVLRSTEQTVNGEWNIENPARRRLKTREASDARLKVGDLVVTKSSGSELHIGKTSIVDASVAALNCCFSNFMQRLRVASPNLSRYCWYLLNCPVAREQLVFLSSTTTGLGNLNGSILGSIRVPVAPDDEPQAIVAFLDREIAKIDALRANKERLIELLQEKRIALITHAVTKGLDPNVPMKDSGVEWLGKIPAHWEVKRLRHIGMALIGLTYEPADVVGPDEGVLVLRASNVYDARIVLEDNVFVKRSIPDRLITKVGDILICARSGSRALIGKSAKIDKAFVDLTFGTFMIVFRSNYNDYLFYAFNSTLFNYQSGAFLTSTINQLTLSNLNSFTVPVPPAPEQEAIAVFLDRETAKIDALVKKVQEAVQRLKEYRTALISAAVTGKIDVRDEVRW